MTKIKMVSRSVVGATATSMKIKTNKATPLNASKGKIQKNRTNAKGEKIDAKQNEYINNYLEIQSKIRLCFVNIKRDTSQLSKSNSTEGVIDSSNHTQTQQMQTLQDQCTNDIDRKTISNNSVTENHLITSDTNDSVASARDNSSKKETEYVNRKCVVKLQRLPTSMGNEKELNARLAKDALLAAQIISPTLDREKRNAFRKLSLSMNRNPKDSDENTVESSSITSQKTTFNLSNKSTDAREECQQQRKLRNSKQSAKSNTVDHPSPDGRSYAPEGTGIPAKVRHPVVDTIQRLKDVTTTTVDRHNESRTMNNIHNQIPSCSHKNIEKGSLKENPHFNTSTRCDKENQIKHTTRYQLRKNALSAEPKVTLGNNIHRNPTLSNSKELHVKQNSKTCPKIVSNLKLLTTKSNKNTCVKYDERKSHNENGITNKSKDKSSRYRENQKDEALDSCIAASTSPSKDVEPQCNSCLNLEDQASSVKLASKDGSTRFNGIEQDSNSKTVPKLAKVKGKQVSNTKNVKGKGKDNKTTATDSITSSTTLQRPNNNMSSPSIIEFFPQRNSTMRFQNLGRLTVIESCIEDTTKNADEQHNTIAGSDNISHSHTTTENQTKSNKINKFFHRHEMESSQAPRDCVVLTNSNNVAFLPKRSSQFRREQVYDFLSQSQTSDSDGTGTKNHKLADPTADIIKKLIAEGKVAVATRKKGKGKPVLKRCSKRKPIPKKVATKKNAKAIDYKSTSKNPTEKQKKTHFDAEDERDHFEDDNFMDNDDDLIYVGEPYNIQTHSTFEPAKKVLSRNTKFDQEGSFSNLARSVLINQTGRNNMQRLKAQRLLSMAKKLISTPKNKNIPSIRTTIHAGISPIPPRPATKPSPWRVDEYAHLPRVFNFSRSSGNLPSFSSDYIPRTPRKEKTNNADKSAIAETEVQQGQFESSPPPIMEGIAANPSHSSTPLATYGDNSSIPSFSSNDSNAENKTPPKHDKQTNDENANIFNLKQLPNPRRALNYRSPLRAINITEVVQLPSLEMSKILNYKANPQLVTITNNKNLSKIERLKSVNIPKEDLFGFEDFLSETEHNSQENETQAVNIAPTSKDPINTINEKRHGLRKLKPDTTELQICLQRTAIDAAENVSEKNKHLFLDAHCNSKPQKTVKEMLCSTMLNEKPTTSRKALEEMRGRTHGRIEEESNISEMLFRDNEPETTFNEEDPHRTYIRPHKRKRRLNENGLVYAFESDVSDNEENKSAGKKKNADNQSRETDTSSEQPKKKKKRRPKENPELIHFVEDFNEMCKEVEKYHLIVEKSEF